MTKYFIRFLGLVLMLWAQETYGQITASFSSLNAKTDPGVEVQEMLHINLSKIYSQEFSSLQKGLKSQVPSPRGYIVISVYLYDDLAASGKGGLLLQYHAQHFNDNAGTLVETGSDYFDTDIELSDVLVPTFIESWHSTDIKATAVTAGTKFNKESDHTYASISPHPHSFLQKDLVPIVVEVAIVDATLYSFAIPSIGEMEAKEFADLQEILRKYHDPQGHSNYVIIAAHRGYWKDHAENSLAAFQAAIDQKVDMVEVDLKKTSDGHLILAHDFQLGRLTDIPTHLQQSQFQDAKHRDYVLSKMTLCDIRPDLSTCPSMPGAQAVKLLRFPDEAATGTGTTTEVLPTFEEFLDLCKGKIMVSLDKLDKDPEMMRIAYEMVRDKGMLFQTVFQGSGTKNLSYYTSAYKGDGVENIMFTPSFFDDNYPTPYDFMEKVDSFITAGFSVPNCNVNYRNDNDQFLVKAFDGNSKDFVEYLHSQNIRSAMFPQWAETQRGNYNPGYRLYNDIRPDLDRRTDWDWMLSKGADMLITDRLEVLVKLLEAKGLRY